MPPLKLFGDFVVKTDNAKVRIDFMKKAIFITGTDTGVGKTITTLVVGLLLQRKGIDVGIFKPIQCAGNDAAVLKEGLKISDSLSMINPYYAKEPLSPHIAFKRANKKIDINKIKKVYKELASRHDILLVEGAGGLLVPIKKNYLTIDLIKELDAEVVVVSRLGLGTINHTLLTVKYAQQQGLTIAGVIFSQSENTKQGTAELTNPEAIQAFGRVPVLGSIPYLKSFRKSSILKKCNDKIDCRRLLKKKKLPSSKNLSHWDKKYLWHPFTQMKDWIAEEPLVIDKAQGCYLYDTKGEKYLDGVSSLWVTVHGHGKQEINHALAQQIRKLDHSTLLGLANTPSIELAKRLVEITPEGLNKVFYSESGSTSVEIAIKMAYQYWQNQGKIQKTKIAHLANSYHGDTLGSVSVGGIDLFHKVYKDLIFDAIKLHFCDCYRAPRGKKYPQYAVECLDKIEKVLSEKNKSIAALIVEPIVQAAAGMIMWPEGILRGMADICRRNDILFIADEVATGMGRTGAMFACQHEGVVPDIMCLAKGLSGGYLPLSATITKDKIYDAFWADYRDQKTFFHGHTYTGNPICAAAAIANIDVFKKESTLKKMQAKIKFLKDKLARFYDLSIVGDVRQKGFMVGIELVKNQQTKEPFDWAERIGIQVCQRARARGVILRPLGNVIVLMPPLSISKLDLEKLLSVAYESIHKTCTIGIN